MRLEIHYRIAKKISAEIKELGFNLHETSFIFGNFFPDLIHSYFWNRHEYPVSRNYLQKMIERLKKKPLFFSFQLGILTHYLSDYFCYPHSRVYDKGIFDHIMYEIRQKVPKEFYTLNLNIQSFAIEEVDKWVSWYEKFRPLFEDDANDFHVAAIVSCGFMQAAYQ
ncbi:MAG: zinc dependent phospholipase C family protein [Treponema sp.]|jgi:hypothetical protein|nr:zinc dependent phospholipase C family protein [Treponema sp.]